MRSTKKTNQRTERHATQIQNETQKFEKIVLPHRKPYQPEKYRKSANARRLAALNPYKIKPEYTGKNHPLYVEPRGLL